MVEAEAAMHATGGILVAWSIGGGEAAEREREFSLRFLVRLRWNWLRWRRGRGLAGHASEPSDVAAGAQDAEWIEDGFQFLHLREIRRTGPPNPFGQRRLPFSGA